MQAFFDYFANFVTVQVTIHGSGMRWTAHSVRTWFRSKGRFCKANSKYRPELLLWAAFQAVNSNQFSLRLHCYGICSFQVAFGEGQIPSWPNLHVLTDFAASAKPWAELLPIFLTIPPSGFIMTILFQIFQAQRGTIAGIISHMVIQLLAEGKPVLPARLIQIPGAVAFCFQLPAL